MAHEMFPGEGFDFEDVILVPGKCQVSSRSQIDVSTKLGNHRFKLPVIPANMSSIIDDKLAVELASNEYFYVMHRFDVDPVDFTSFMHKQDLISSISVGVQEKDFEDVQRLASLDREVEYVTVDIAHGHAPSVYRIVEHIRKHLPQAYIIAGNVATGAGARALADAGASAAKLGVGPGLACLTSPNTGFGTRGWQLSAVAHAAEAVSIDVIADGGIRTHGDIAKALAFGAKAVMVGGMFAGHDESPGDLVEQDGELFKAFYGSASAQQKGNTKNVEGKSMLVAYRGPLAHTLESMTDNLQSAVSYAGGTHIEDLTRVGYVRVQR